MNKFQRRQKERGVWREVQQFQRRGNHQNSEQYSWLRGCDKTLYITMKYKVVKYITKQQINYNTLQYITIYLIERECSILYYKYYTIKYIIV